MSLRFIELISHAHLYTGLVGIWYRSFTLTCRRSFEWVNMNTSGRIDLENAIYITQAQGETVRTQFLNIIIY